MLLYAALLLIQTAPACTEQDADLPRPLAAWATAYADSPTASNDDLRRPVILVTVGELGRDELELPDGARAGPAATMNFHIDAAGTYGIALDQRGWIDVIPLAKGSAPLKSVAHGHGPDCSSIRKIVRFRLEPGDYRLALTGVELPLVKVMLVAGE